ncbi:MAG: hypothetical protein Q4B52_04750 [Tissierellia bacterium]|nr:hypothetical protein [Tissierellia bacterium]
MNKTKKNFIDYISYIPFIIASTFFLITFMEYFILKNPFSIDVIIKSFIFTFPQLIFFVIIKRHYKINHISKISISACILILAIFINVLEAMMI